jgi:hypothetical protein
MARDAQQIGWAESGSRMTFLRQLGENVLFNDFSQAQIYQPKVVHTSAERFFLQINEHLRLVCACAQNIKF